MELHQLGARPHWQTTATGLSFGYHTLDNMPYWDESHAYKFEEEEVDEIEYATDELTSMCYRAVSEVVGSKALMTKLAIPEEFHGVVAQSWYSNQRDLYGRFDLSYRDGEIKMLEFNADTPTSLFESAVVQWQWLEEMIELGRIESDSDQFNSIHEALIAAFSALKTDNPRMHFIGHLDSIEDYGNLEYLEDCASQAGITTKLLDITDVGVDPIGRFTDLDNHVIESMFKLYPWEFMVREGFKDYLKLPMCRIFEPAWKMVLSNKGILPILWEMFPGNDYLLPSYFADSAPFFANGMVRKPLLSREGANVSLLNPDGSSVYTDGAYGDEGYVVQEAAVLPKFDDEYAVIGSWVIAGKSHGMCIRADESPITKNTSRFIPHFVD